MKATYPIPFDPAGWLGYAAFRVKETAGLDRERGVVDFSFEIAGVPADMRDHELRVVLSEAGSLAEIPSQFYGLSRDGRSRKGRVAFFIELPAGGARDIRIYYGKRAALPTDYPTSLRIAKGAAGPLHYFLENDYYKLETMPKSGQIWHVWNKLGSNTSWHHNEWNANREKGGDPCHWAPNCWIAYPERVTNGYTGQGENSDSFDWHYVFGWDNPRAEIVQGPVFFEMRRKDVVPPHPEHSNPNIRRDSTAKVIAEVVYRFYDGAPWFYQSSDMSTLQDFNSFFIRNSQFVFLTNVFTHAIICPDPDGLRPTDEVEPAVIRLMAKLNVKPTAELHSTSNVLPSKLNYTSFFNNTNGDGFAQFQILERNTNAHTGKPTYYNHTTLLTEQHNWSVYFCRAFSYTNRRFHPENAVFLPRGERYQEENIGLIYRHDDIAATLEKLDRLGREFRNPLRAEQIN